MRAALVLVALVVLAACGAAEPAGAGRVERCVDRLLSRADVGESAEESAREYARTTYCRRFERNGWVYDDGALSIDAQEWLDQGGRCETATPAGRQPETCDRVDDTGTADCALLHHVRRREVRAYVALQGVVACDDGTPLHELGVP